MNSRQARKHRRRLEPILRALEGGYFDGVLAATASFTERRAFAERASELLGRPWSWPKAGQASATLKEALVDRKFRRDGWAIR